MIVLMQKHAATLFDSFLCLFLFLFPVFITRSLTLSLCLVDPIGRMFNGKFCRTHKSATHTSSASISKIITRVRKATRGKTPATTETKTTTASATT